MICNFLRNDLGWSGLIKLGPWIFQHGDTIFDEIHVMFPTHIPYPAQIIGLYLVDSIAVSKLQHAYTEEHVRRNIMLFLGRAQ